MSQSENTGSSGVRFAGFWIRFAASFIDWTILTIASWVAQLMILGVVYWMRIFVSHSGGGTGGFFDAFNPLWLQVMNGILYLLLSLPYYIIGHRRYGTTLGKRPFRIYVVDNSTLGPITLKQSVIRCFGYAVSYMVFMVGFIMAAYHPTKRALHDLIAGTVSVRRN